MASASTGTPAQQLQAFREALEQFRAGGLTAHALSEWARGQQELLVTLPDAFTVVLHQLMDRLESSALFSEESCSFSQRDLVDSLLMWADKAAKRLSSAPSE